MDVGTIVRIKDSLNKKMFKRIIDKNMYKDKRRGKKRASDYCSVVVAIDF